MFVSVFTVFVLLKFAKRLTGPTETYIVTCDNHTWDKIFCCHITGIIGNSVHLVWTLHRSGSLLNSYTCGSHSDQKNTPDLGWNVWSPNMIRLQSSLLVPFFLVISYPCFLIYFFEALANTTQMCERFFNKKCGENVSRVKKRETKRKTEKRERVIMMTVYFTLKQYTIWHTSLSNATWLRFKSSIARKYRITFDFVTLPFTHLLLPCFACWHKNIQYFM